MPTLSCARPRRPTSTSFLTLPWTGVQSPIIATLVAERAMHTAHQMITRALTISRDSIVPGYSSTILNYASPYPPGTRVPFTVSLLSFRLQGEDDPAGRASGVSLTHSDYFPAGSCRHPRREHHPKQLSRASAAEQLSSFNNQAVANSSASGCYYSASHLAYTLSHIYKYKINKVSDGTVTHVHRTVTGKHQPLELAHRTATAQWHAPPVAVAVPLLAPLAVRSDAILGR